MLEFDVLFVLPGLRHLVVHVDVAVFAGFLDFRESAEWVVTCWRSASLGVGKTAECGFFWWWCCCCRCSSLSLECRSCRSPGRAGCLACERVTGLPTFKFTCSGQDYSMFPAARCHLNRNLSQLNLKSIASPIIRTRSALHLDPKQNSTTPPTARSLSIHLLMSMLSGMALTNTCTGTCRCNGGRLLLR